MAITFEIKDSRATIYWDGPIPVEVVAAIASGARTAPRRAAADAIARSRRYVAGRQYYVSFPFDPTEAASVSSDLIAMIAVAA